MLIASPSSISSPIKFAASNEAPVANKDNAKLQTLTLKYSVDKHSTYLTILSQRKSFNVNCNRLLYHNNAHDTGLGSITTVPIIDVFRPCRMRVCTLLTRV